MKLYPTITPIATGNVKKSPNVTLSPAIAPGVAVRPVPQVTSVRVFLN